MEAVVVMIWIGHVEAAVDQLNEMSQHDIRQHLAASPTYPKSFHCSVDPHVTFLRILPLCIQYYHWQSPHTAQAKLSQHDWWLLWIMHQFTVLNVCHGAHY
jgi:hypothetical protein